VRNISLTDELRKSDDVPLSCSSPQPGGVLPTLGVWSSPAPAAAPFPFPFTFALPFPVASAASFAPFARPMIGASSTSETLMEMLVLTPLLR